MIYSYMKRFTRLIFGLFLYAVGIALAVQANVGLAPWDAFAQGLTVLSGISLGKISVLVGVVIVILDYCLGETIGFGTILNAVLIGTFLDLILMVDMIPMMDSLVLGVLMQLSGLMVIGLASYFYITAGMGCGPRDGLMVAMCRRFPTVPVGVVRSILEGTVLLLGWVFGGTIGVGTVVAVFGLGGIIETTFRLFRFDVKALVHESVVDTVKIMAAYNGTEEKNKIL